MKDQKSIIKSRKGAARRVRRSLDKAQKAFALAESATQGNEGAHPTVLALAHKEAMQACRDALEEALQGFHEYNAYTNTLYTG